MVVVVVNGAGLFFWESGIYYFITLIVKICCSMCVDIIDKITFGRVKKLNF